MCKPEFYKTTQKLSYLLPNIILKNWNKDADLLQRWSHVSARLTVTGSSNIRIDEKETCITLTMMMATSVDDDDDDDDDDYDVVKSVKAVSC